MVIGLIYQFTGMQALSRYVQPFVKPQLEVLLWPTI